MIKRLHDENSQSHVNMITHILNKLPSVKKIKKINRCLTRLISENAIKFDPLYREGGYDDWVERYYD